MKSGTPPRSEVAFLRYAAKRRWAVLRAGWPDCLVMERDGRFRFIEVKLRRGHGLQRSQRAMFAALHRIGIVVEVWDADLEDFRPWHQATRLTSTENAAMRRPWRARRYDPVLGV